MSMTCTVMVCFSPCFIHSTARILSSPSIFQPENTTPVSSFGLKNMIQISGSTQLATRFGMGQLRQWCLKSSGWTYRSWLRGPFIKQENLKKASFGLGSIQNDNYGLQKQNESNRNRKLLQDSISSHSTASHSQRSAKHLAERTAHSSGNRCQLRSHLGRIDGWRFCSLFQRLTIA